jgi:hypothetical protein
MGAAAMPVLRGLTTITVPQRESWGRSKEPAQVSNDSPSTVSDRALPSSDPPTWLNASNVANRRPDVTFSV